MFETSKDIWFLVLSICVSFFTIFLCILLYYVIKIFRQFNHAVKEIKTRVANIHSTIEKGFSSLGVVTEVAKMAMGYLMNKKEGKKKKD